MNGAEAPREESGRLARWAAALSATGGWRRWLIACLLGVVATLALPPLHLVPALIPAFTGLLWLLAGAQRVRQAFLLGWAFGFGHMLSGLYWVGFAFLVDAPRFAAVMPLAVVGMAAAAGLYPALAITAAWRLAPAGAARVAALAGFWLLGEWLRSWLFTGFAWNLMGTVWAFSPAALQLAALGGVWGLSLITLLAAAAPAALARPGRGPRLFALMALALPLASWAGGALSLAAAPALGAAVVPGVTLRLVQPAIAQSRKWRNDLRQQHVLTQMAMTREAGFDGVTLAVWAETAVPFFLGDEVPLKRLLATAVPREGLLITGAPRQAKVEKGRKLFNSLYLINQQGDIVASYDKVHLVPFGEYMPLRGFLGLDKLAAGAVDFSPGAERRILDLPGFPPASPLICYEVIFPGEVGATGERRPAWLLNLTNDAWFGISSGPYQHFAAARLRTVEEGLPLVRVANNGISAVVDAYGRVSAYIGLNQRGIVDATLPAPRLGSTLYARTGNWLLLPLLVIAGVLSIILRRYST